MLCWDIFFFITTGGNLCVSLCLKAASYGVRLPDGILTSYAPFNVRFCPSPSRLLTLLDPLLPVGIISQCLAAYLGRNAKDNVGDLQEAQDEGKNILEEPEDVEKDEGKCSSEKSKDSCASERSKEDRMSEKLKHKCVSNKADPLSSDDGCSSKNDKRLPDVVTDTQSGSDKMKHGSSDSDFFYSHMHNDGLPYHISMDADQNDLEDESPLGLLKDDHLKAMAKNPYISPLVASNEQLAMLPSMDIVVSR